MGVEVRGLTVAYRRREALARVSLTAQPGVVTAVLGPNGAGKTTLLSVLATAQPVGAGVAFVDGHDVGTTDGRAAAREVLGWLPQRFDLAGGMRLLDTVAFAAWANGVGEGDAFRLASDALDRVGLASRERERVRTLSGGQRQRLGLAAATAHGPRVLLTPVWELVPVLLAAALPALLVSRLASWEHTQHRRLRTRAATVAVAAVTIPASIPWVAQFRLPDDARWVDITCNVALFAAVALVATCVFGRLAGPAVALMAYVGTIGVQQLSPALAARLPVSGARTNLQPHPWPTVVVVLVAVAAWTVTLGRSRWTARRTRHD